MALLLLAGAGYAAYKQQQQKEASAAGGILQQAGSSQIDPNIDLSGMGITSSVEFLPHEMVGGIFSTSTTTITFYKGDYLDVKHFLEDRVHQILKVNPWLGGWLSPPPKKKDEGDDDEGDGDGGEDNEKHASDGSAFQLWYDPNGEKYPPGIFTCMEPGEIPLKRSTKYGQYNDICADFRVKVPMTEKLIGQNRPVFKVTIIPDCVEHHERFAMVVSISHICGDPYTYHQIYKMLLATASVGDNSSSTTTTTTTTTPTTTTTTILPTLYADRKLSYQYSVMKYVGEEEAKYLQKANDDLLDGVIAKFNSLMSQSRDKKNQNYKVGGGGGGDKETLLFTVNVDWLQQQKNDNDDDEEEEEEGAQNTTNITGHQREEEESGKATTASTPKEILLSWWLNTTQPDIGFVTKQLRNDLDILSSSDAGNYMTPIPLTPIDYSTPRLIHDAIVSGKRCGKTTTTTNNGDENVNGNDDEAGSITPLPSTGHGKSFAIGVDWTDLSSPLSASGRQIDDEFGLEVDLKIPLFTVADLKALPDKLSVMVVFEAKKDQQQQTSSSSSPPLSSNTNSRRLGILVSAPTEICERISSSGIIDEDMTSSLTMDVVSNRRGSIVDFDLPEGMTLADTLGIEVPLED